MSIVNEDKSAERAGGVYKRTRGIAQRKRGENIKTTEEAKRSLS